MLLLSLLSVVLPASASALPRLLTQDDERPFQIKPKIVSYTGDGTGYLGGRRSSPRHMERDEINWLKWNRHFAFGRGYAWLNRCRPSCAAGRFVAHRMSVRVSRPRKGVFTRITIHYRWGDRWRYDRRKLEGSGDGRYFYWGICGRRFGDRC